MLFEINDLVELHSTGDKTLDGQLALVKGRHEIGYLIVVFVRKPPAGYNPAMVISEHCLKEKD